MTKRIWITLAVAIVFALILFFPLRLAISLVGGENTGISARNISGTIWGGRAEEVRIGAIDLGSLDIGLDPVSLLAANLTLRFTRTEGAPDAPLSGAIILGPNHRALDHVTGLIRGLESPIDGLMLDDFSVRFADGRCSQANGRIQAKLAMNIAGLDLRHGLSGTATCRNDALFVPLLGQSGMERINVSVDGDGRYTAALSIRSPDPMLAAALAATGLTATNDGFGMTLRGQF
ncbi:MAG: type II secretion system protein N [Sphingopyxis sp.]